jgi:hypothetical protein
MDAAVLDTNLSEKIALGETPENGEAGESAGSNSVDTRELLDELVAEFRRYLSLPDGGLEVIALWALHTHVFPAWTHSPRLAFLGPVPGCGKTRALSVLGTVVAKPHPTSNITGPGLFRIVQRDHPTLLLDEVDTYLEGNSELRNVLNSGHERSGAATRCDGDTHSPNSYSTWAPLALAKIGNLPDTIRDRSIVIQMRRMRADEGAVEVFRSARARELHALNSKAKLWGKQQIDRLHKADPSLPTGLKNRAADNWRPFLSIAELAGPEWAEKCRELAIGFSLSDDEAPTPIQLLSDIKSAIYGLSGDWISSELLHLRLVQMADRPWGDNQSENSIRTLHALASRLRPFGIKPVSYRDGDSTRRGYLLAEFEDAFSRYPD